MNIQLICATFLIVLCNFGSQSFQTNRYAKKCDCVCGSLGRRPKIVGGREVAANEFPWQVGLFRSGKLYCGASIITQRYLLTAGHCVSSFEPYEIRAWVGSHNVTQRDFTEIKRIKKIITHEKFDLFNFNNDIALLELDTPIAFGAKSTPICLPKGDVTDFTNKLTLVAGWGRLSERSTTASTLQAALIPIWSKQQCISSGYGPSKITDNMMCGGYPEGEIDACQGDSGGPMISEGKTGSIEVIGIVSWGRGCARKNLPGIYTKVVNYLPWIQKHIEGECLCKPRQGSRTNFIEHFKDNDY